MPSSGRPSFGQKSYTLDIACKATPELDVMDMPIDVVGAYLARADTPGSVNEMTVRDRSPILMRNPLFFLVRARA